MNKFFKANFNSENSIISLKIYFYFQEDQNSKYQIIVSNEESDIYKSIAIKSEFWFRDDYHKFFKYNIKLLQFDGNDIKIIHEENFDIKDHNILIILKSIDPEDIKIWKNYLSFVEKELNVKFEIVINDISNIYNDDEKSSIEISRKCYDNFLRSSEIPLTEDYSSLTIIKTLFNILDDKSLKNFSNYRADKNDIKIVGCFFGAHDFGFSLIENNEIVACYSEERFSRIKSCYNWTFPKFSLEAIQKDFNINITDSNVHLVSAKPVSISFTGISDILNHKPIKLYDHYYSHACGAYYTSGFDENTLIVIYDAGDGGDDNFTELNKNNIDKYFEYDTVSVSRKNLSHSAFFIVEDGKLVEIGDRLKNGSIAQVWVMICHIFGLTGLKDEGKIMGLAAQGRFDEKIYNQLKYFVDNDCCSASYMFDDYYKDLLQKLPLEEQLDLKRRLAYNLQLITERTIVKIIDDVNKKYGPFKNLCVAGGVFANVKLNQKINERLSFDNVWVYPAMSDEGLSLGSAIAHGVELGVFTNRRIENAFFGKKYKESEIDIYLSNFKNDFGKELISQQLDYDIVADLLVAGKVVAIFDGAAEYGPRALGNRSIMVEPTKAETHAYINMRLKRDEIMPFAPIIMEEYADEILYYNKSKYTSEFMTMCYKVKEEWISKIPAVINTYDGTARPQVVNKDRHKHFHNILSKFYERTGIPVLMNTSFNGHGEPIINSPKEALTHLSDGTIDYLIINNKICNIL